MMNKKENLKISSREREELSVMEAQRMSDEKLLELAERKQESEASVAFIEAVWKGGYG